MTSEADIARYVQITHAHQVLNTIGTEADALQRLTVSKPFDEDASDFHRPLYDGLAVHLDTAAKAATGTGAPLDPTTIDYDYTAALADALDRITTTARGIAERARAVRDALDAGLITDPRTWTAEQINAGHMLTALQPADTRTDAVERYAFDHMFLEGCVNALNRERFDNQSISTEVFDRHMDRITAVSGVVEAIPAGTAEHVAEALAQWKATEEEAGSVLDVYKPAMGARLVINTATTYDLLHRLAMGLTGPGWDEHRRAAHKHMLSLSRKAWQLRAGGDLHGDASDLLEFINDWRQATYLEQMEQVQSFTVMHFPVPTEVYAVAENTAYEALYLAADLAVTTQQLLAVWEASARLTDGHRENIRVGVMNLFEQSHTRSGASLADSGPALTGFTVQLRKAVDAHPLPALSNQGDVLAYRALRKDIEDIDMGALCADGLLITEWTEVLDGAAAGAITTRQASELRRVVNAKIAEYCGGDEQKAHALAARLPQWTESASW